MEDAEVHSEAVGRQVTVQQHATVRFPHFGDSEALLVRNSPNCMSVGKRVRTGRYGFSWFPEDLGGANWWVPNAEGGYTPLRCDAASR